MKLVFTLPLVELLVRVLEVSPGIKQVYNKIFFAIEMNYMYIQIILYSHDIRAGCDTDGEQCTYMYFLTVTICERKK